MNSSSSVSNTSTIGSEPQSSNTSRSSSAARTSRIPEATTRSAAIPRWTKSSAVASTFSAIRVAGACPRRRGPPARSSQKRLIHPGRHCCTHQRAAAMSAPSSPEEVRTASATEPAVDNGEPDGAQPGAGDHIGRVVDRGDRRGLLDARGMLTEASWVASKAWGLADIAWCNSLSWRAKDELIAAGCSSHRRDESSISVNSRVSVPDGSSTSTTPAFHTAAVGASASQIRNPVWTVRRVVNRPIRASEASCRGPGRSVPDDRRHPTTVCSQRFNVLNRRFGNERGVGIRARYRGSASLTVLDAIRFGEPLWKWTLRACASCWLACPT